MPFELASNFTHHHLIVQPSDLALNPPESYLFIQDGLIISCGVLYALCYLFYMIRTYKDKTCAGAIEYLCGTMSYELYYALATTSTNLERFCFLVWFLLDISFVIVAVSSAYPPQRRRIVVTRLVVGTLAGLATFHLLCRLWPDEREQVTAYWTGLLLQLPIGWVSLKLLLERGETRGHSLEIWVTRYLGCCTAYGVFIWRYLNVPTNWAYVGSFWSVAIMVATMLPETVYPFVYVYVHQRREKQKAA